MARGAQRTAGRTDAPAPRPPDARGASASGDAGAHALARFSAHCRAHGLSVTRQRLAIFEALAASRAHPGAEDLHRLVRRRHPRISLATVYKNLEALRTVGAVGAVNPLHVEGRFEAALPGTGAGVAHHHLVCTRCLKVCDLPAGAVATPVLPRESAQGFEVQAVRVQVEGLCPECRPG